MLIVSSQKKKSIIVVPTKNDSDVILFIIAKSNINLYTPLELTRIDRSLVLLSYPADRLNTQVIYRLQVPDTFVNKTWR